MIKSWAFSGLLFVLQLVSATAFAHESRPAYLQINESKAGVFEINWRRPALGDRVLSLRPVFPEQCQPQGGVASYLSQCAQVQRWTIRCQPAGLTGYTLYIWTGADHYRRAGPDTVPGRHHPYPHPQIQ
jgi:hypothetical protein